MLITVKDRLLQFTLVVHFYTLRYSVSWYAPFKLVCDPLIHTEREEE